MQLCRVAGTVTATRNADGVSGPKYLIVEACDSGGAGLGSRMVALDTVGAGSGELVFVSQGSSARQTAVSNGKALDAVIVGIVDMIEENSKVTYQA